MKTQKVCECQDVSFNKDALILLSSDYINWFLDYLSAKTVFFNTFSQHSSVSSAQYSNEFSLKLPCKLFQRCRFWYLELFQNDEFWNSFSDVTSSAIRCLKFSSKLSQRDIVLIEIMHRRVVWSFRANFLNVINLDRDHASMQRLQKRTNRNSIHVLTWDMT